MAGMPGRGGHNKLSAAEHVLRGTFRKDRHALLPAAVRDAPVSKADRRRVLHGLDPEGRRLDRGELAHAPLLRGIVPPLGRDQR